MYYIQYYHLNLENKLTEATGDRSVVIIDGRMSLATMHSEAKFYNMNVNRRYAGYMLMKGQSFCRSYPISKLINCNKESVTYEDDVK